MLAVFSAYLFNLAPKPAKRALNVLFSLAPGEAEESRLTRLESLAPAISVSTENNDEVIK